MRLRLKPVAEQVIVITGASSGIGLVTARMAASRGARVVLVARNGSVLEQVVSEIVSAGGQAAHAVADVGVFEEVQAAAEEAIRRFGRIDCWVNNAGVAIYAKLIETPMAEHERLFRTNYFGMVHGALTAIEHLRRSGGALITVASIAGEIPSPIMGAYAASKHAVAGYVQSLRIEAIADRLPISVTLIKPSGISTPIADHAANHVDGQALIPPPVYDPVLVARAILDAAEHPRREVTVGGVGRLQTVLAEHFPVALDYMGNVLSRMLHDREIPKTATDNLEAPVRDGRQRSAVQSGRRVSLYEVIPGPKAIIAAGLAAAALTILTRLVTRGASVSK